jgi:type I restriction enzyme R subunit
VTNHGWCNITTDTSEKGLEALIVESLTGKASRPEASGGAAADQLPFRAGALYVEGNPKDYDRSYAVDLPKLLSFLDATQPEVVRQLGLNEDGPRRQQFLARLQGEITRRGIVDVLRHGVKHGPAALEMFYGTPTAGNPKAEELFNRNIFSVTRQLRYSTDEALRALDLCLFINGLPVITFELKNRLTGQTYDDAVRQYMRDRDPRELLFQFGRCIVHFAVDDQEVRMCTSLKGKASWFLPFNKGYQDGAGNPPNPDGIMTDYLWREVLARESLADIIENYAQIVERKDEKTGRKRRDQIFPRYHQLDVVRKLLATAANQGAGGRYLIQHSAGSGKSNSIAWLAHQLIDLKQNDRTIFDSIIVVTDRKVLDRQIRDTIKQFAQVNSIVGHAEHSGDLRKFIEDGKKVIITTVQKFPFILADIGDEHRTHKFAIVIDEAHSSQGGRTTGKMHQALSERGGEEEVDTFEDRINRIMEWRKMLTNASYFAFTATPKNKTLELFGEPCPEGEKVRHRPFHSYTMKQAIQEGFILDVLQNFTPVGRYIELRKTAADDPMFDTRRAQKKLKRYVEGHETAINKNTRLMVDHFLEQVVARRKIGGQARAMLVTSGIERAIRYYSAIKGYLIEMKSPYQAIVAFSGEHEYGGQSVTEALLNGFPGNKIPEMFREEPYRFLVVAEKFQTGYDEPLLHTMYVDKELSDIKAVQTLSRLNRAYPGKYDTFVLDFRNSADRIQAAFEPYYRTTILSEETDPNKLHDLKSALDACQVYTPEQIAQLVELFLSAAERPRLDAILDACVAVYKDQLDEDGQVSFKSNAKMFVRTYGFLASVLPYTNAEWEKLSIFLNFLIPKLPAPEEKDLAHGILETIDMDKYRVEAKASMAIKLDDAEGEIGPVPIGKGGGKPEPELDLLSNIVKEFNEQFGNIDWQEPDRIPRVIAEDIAVRVAADKAYQNARRNSDRQNARIEHDLALKRVVTGLISDHTELFRQFSENASFQKWLADTVFSLTYEQTREQSAGQEKTGGDSVSVR